MIQATYKTVIVKVHYESQIGSSSIILPDYQSAIKQVGNFWGEVMSIGEGNTLGLKIGDKIIFQRGEGKKVIDDGEEYMSLKQDYIEAVIT